MTNAKIAQKNKRTAAKAALKPNKPAAKPDSIIIGGSPEKQHSAVVRHNGKSRKLSIGNLIDAIAPDEPLLLPPNCRGIFGNEDEFFCVLEFAPRIVRVKWEPDDEPSRAKLHDAKNHEVSLSFPYVILLLWFERVGKRISYVDTSCFFAKQSLQSLNDRLYYPNIDNCACDEDGYDAEEVPSNSSTHVCLGQREGWVNGRDFALPGVLNELVKRISNAFWGAKFNRDYGYSWHNYYCDYNQMFAIEPWAKLTSLDPNAGVKMPWLEGPTLRQYIEYNIDNPIRRNSRSQFRNQLSRAAISNIVFNFGRIPQ